MFPSLLFQNASPCHTVIMLLYWIYLALCSISWYVPKQPYHQSIESLLKIYMLQMIQWSIYIEWSVCAWILHVHFQMIFFLNGCDSTKHVYWNSRQGSFQWKMLHTIHEEKSTLSPLLMFIARFIRWRRIKGGFNISKPTSTHPKAISKKKRSVAGIKYINIYTSLKLWEGDKYLYTTDIWSTVCRRHFRLHFV